MKFPACSEFCVDTYIRYIRNSTAISTPPEPKGAVSSISTIRRRTRWTQHLTGGGGHRGSFVGVGVHRANGVANRYGHRPRGSSPPRTAWRHGLYDSNPTTPHIFLTRKRQVPSPPLTDAAPPRQRQRTAGHAYSPVMSSHGLGAT
jgi:hypothetical protein